MLKNTAALAMCYYPGLVRDKQLGAPAYVKLVFWWRHLVSMSYNPKHCKVSQYLITNGVIQCIA